VSLFESIYRFFGWWIINIDLLFIAFLILGGLLLFFRRRTGGKRFVILGCSGLLFFAIVPVGLWTFENLENRFPKVLSLPPTAKGIILLGGSFDQMTTRARGETAYNLAAGNFIRFVQLAKENPHMQLVYTGNAFETELAKKELAALGIDPSRVQFANQAKDTKENALRTKDLLNPQPQDQWVLVASAYHMPRSVGLFRKVGFNVIPYPVDYHTPGQYEPWFFLGLKLNLDAWQVSSREWLGMVINSLMGRSDQIYAEARE
jgi:uncharacterized SAM-binding protein YcdF (DUF218 family)